MRAFLDKHPRHRLASNAYYWLGETYYVRRNFQKAVHIFAEGYQKLPKGGKSADNLLKLGMSLDKLNKKKEACTTFAKLTKEFPNADKDIKDKITSEQKRLECS